MRKTLKKLFFFLVFSFFIKENSKNKLFFLLNKKPSLMEKVLMLPTFSESANIRNKILPSAWDTPFVQLHQLSSVFDIFIEGFMNIYTVFYFPYFENKFTKKWYPIWTWIPIHECTLKRKQTIEKFRRKKRQVFYIVMRIKINAN